MLPTLCRIALLTLAVLVLSPPGHAQDDPAAPGWHEEQLLDVAGTSRYYRYFVPAQLTNPATVVILLHGGGSNMRAVTNPPGGSGSLWPVIADQQGILLLVPNGTNIDTGDPAGPAGNKQNWNDCRIGEITSTADDVGFIDTLLGWTESIFNIDSQRVYSTGASNGGMMTYRLLQELPERLAAGAAFIANQPEPSNCQPKNLPRSVMIVNGSDDPVVLEDGGPVANARRGSSLSATATIQHWQQINQTWQLPASQTDFPDINPDDQSTVQSTLYRGGDNGTEIRYDRVLGGGHSMPSIEFAKSPLLILFTGPQNRDMEGNQEAWQFLSRQRRDGRSDQILNPAALTGAWFDPLTDGEGLLLVSTPFGLGGFYFGNDAQGRRLWTLSELHLDELSWGASITLQLSQSASGNFAQPAPPALSENWGTLSLQFNDCNNATGILNGVDGSKTLALIPLTTVRGQACIPPDN